MLGKHSSSSAAHCNQVIKDFSAPNIDSIDGIPIKRLPSGEALGASDLGRWASNRRSGRPEYEDISGGAADATDITGELLADAISLCHPDKHRWTLLRAVRGIEWM